MDIPPIAWTIIAWAVFAAGWIAFLWALVMLINDTSDAGRHGRRMARWWRRSQHTHQRIADFTSPEYVARVVNHELADKPATKPIPRQEQS